MAAKTEKAATFPRTQNQISTSAPSARRAATAFKSCVRPCTTQVPTALLRSTTALGARLNMRHNGEPLTTCQPYDGVHRNDVGSYAGCMLDLDAVDVEEIASALADQTDYDHRWLIDPRTGEIAFWTSDLGIDGENPVELDELDLILIDPLPSYVWYQDMVYFADGISDRGAGERLSRCLEGNGAFRRFKNELYQRHPELISAWQALRDARARVRAVQWLADEGLIDEDAAQRFQREQREPTLP